MKARRLPLGNDNASSSTETTGLDIRSGVPRNGNSVPSHPTPSLANDDAAEPTGVLLSVFSTGADILSPCGVSKGEDHDTESTEDDEAMELPAENGMGRSQRPDQDKQENVPKASIRRINAAVAGGAGKKREAEKLIDSLTPRLSVSSPRLGAALSDADAPRRTLVATITKSDSSNVATSGRQRRRSNDTNSSNESRVGDSTLMVDATVTIVIDGKIYCPSDGETQGGTALPSPVLPLGHDGNRYYCQVCRGFGDVVCCDGCPNVFHAACVPTGTPSQQDLENDVDPWYCPSCWPLSSGKASSISISSKKIPPMALTSNETNEAPLKRKGPGRPPSADKGKVKALDHTKLSSVQKSVEGKVKAIDHTRLSSLQKCVDCKKIRSDRIVKPCEGCGSVSFSGL
jgi:PHD-finger